MNSIPATQLVNGVIVVRDDLYPGGTKARLFHRLFQEHDEIVYACSAISCTQISLARAAANFGLGSKKRATIWTAQRSELTPQTKSAKDWGARVFCVSPGYLTVVRARAAAYCKRTGAYLSPLGFDTPENINQIADLAQSLKLLPKEVWCACGSGTLARALQKAWPNAYHNVVIVGGKCNWGVAAPFSHTRPFSQPSKFETPFPTEPYYERKAWELCMRYKGSGTVVFWNCLGPIK